MNRKIVVHNEGALRQLNSFARNKLLPSRVTGSIAASVRRLGHGAILLV
jgi:hypothetical protein